MNGLKKVAGINLLILLIYTILVNVGSTGRDRGMQIMFMLMILIVLHVAVNFIASLIFFAKRDKVTGRNFLLSSLIVLLIGFSSCFGAMYYVD